MLTRRFDTTTTTTSNSCNKEGIVSGGGEGYHPKMSDKITLRTETFLLVVVVAVPVYYILLIRTGSSEGFCIQNAVLM